MTGDMQQWAHLNEVVALEMKIEDLNAEISRLQGMLKFLETASEHERAGLKAGVESEQESETTKDTKPMTVDENLDHARPAPMTVDEKLDHILVLIARLGHASDPKPGYCQDAQWNAIFKEGRRAGHEDVALEILRHPKEEAWEIATQFLALHEAGRIKDGSGQK